MKMNSRRNNGRKKNKYHRPWREKLKVILFFLLLAFILIYFSFKIFDYFYGPKIEIFYPEPYQVLPGETFFISGKVKNARNIYLNGREIVIDQNGDFKEELILKNPYTLIVVNAVDKYDREKELVLQVGKE